MEGRDIGTRVFPDAELKIFLTASVKERALRRQQELMARGEAVDLVSLEQAIQERDYRDSTRSISPLRQADNAILIDSDNLTIPEVVARIVELYRALPLGTR
jgi:cytidylate kinase